MKTLSLAQCSRVSGGALTITYGDNDMITFRGTCPSGQNWSWSGTEDQADRFVTNIFTDDAYWQNYQTPVTSSDYAQLINIYMCDHPL